MILQMREKTLSETYLRLGNFFEHHVPNLSKTELIVHDYVLQNAEQVIYSTVAQLSSLIGVGEATIVRYCKKIGYSSFVQMKMEFFKIISEYQDSAAMPYIERIEDTFIKTISATKALINETDIELAKDLILGNKRLLITGQGSSNITAQDAFARFTRIGIDASLVIDNHLLYMYTSILDENTVVICYSFTGETKEVIKVAKMAKQNGCKIIGITNYETSEIARLSDVCLYTSGHDNVQSGFFGSKVSQLFITDVLITRCANENLKKSLHYNERATKSVMQEED
jgi:DNA-binding MurR/RpiR family transcriptional regulator